MKRNLFWSLIAATAFMTACNDDVLMDSPSIDLQGKPVPVALSVNIGEAMTRGTISEQGGWSNYAANQDGMLDIYNHRVIIQIFANGMDKPYVESVNVLNPDGHTAISSEIDLSDLRLPAGNTYKAVVWVDFVDNSVLEEEEINTDLSGIAAGARTGDKYYNTALLTNVSMKEANTNPIDINHIAEGRDAYTGLIEFKLDEDGAITQNGAQTTAPINITAKRILGKVRLVLTDYNNQQAWKTYFANTNNSRTLACTALKISGLATTYNALNNTVDATAGSKKDYTFYHEWKNTAHTTADHISWVKEEGGQYVSAETDGTYPVLDFNYFLPVNMEDQAAYNMNIRMYETPATANQSATFDWDGALDNTDAKYKLLSDRSFSNIPVQTNCLTTIIGNFLTKAYDFKVIVTDGFDNVNSQKVVVADEGDTAGENTYDISGTTGTSAKAVINTNNNNEITTMTITGVNANNLNAVLANIKGLKRTVFANAPLKITATGLSEREIDFTGIPANFTLTFVTDAVSPSMITTSTEGLIFKNIGNDLEIHATANQTVPFVVEGSKQVTMTAETGVSFYTVQTDALFTGTLILNAPSSAVTVESKTTSATIKGNVSGNVASKAITTTLSGNVGGTTTVESTTINITHGEYTGVVTLNASQAATAASQAGSIVISGGTFKNATEQAVKVYSNTTLSGSTMSQSESKLFVFGEARTLTISNHLTGASFNGHVDCTQYDDLQPEKRTTLNLSNAGEGWSNGHASSNFNITGN